MLSPLTAQAPTPRLFVVPNSIALPAWKKEARSRSPGLFQPNGARGLTSLKVIGSHNFHPPFAHEEVQGLSFSTAGDYVAELLLDGGGGGRAIDLRPAVPLLLRYHPVSSGSNCRLPAPGNGC